MTFKARRVLACLGIAVLAGACDEQFSGPPPPEPPDPPGPNFVIILTDDQDYPSAEYMPKLQAMVAAKGTRFVNFFVNAPSCCPSRVSLFRGQYVHNHGVWNNGPNDGGFPKFHELGHEESTLATWLDKAGYRTGLVGKYLNFYGQRGPVHVPPGWDDWYAIYGPDVPGERQPYYGFYMNQNGSIRKYGAGIYVTDILAYHAAHFIRRATMAGERFFLIVAPYAPHEPATPAPRHEGLYWGTPAPRSPSFDEADISDKPPAMQRAPLSWNDLARIDGLYPLQLESLQAVDDAIETIITVLDTTRALDKTYIFYTSDNGFRLGQHRFAAGKGNLYEEEIRVPLIVRGPGIPAGAVRDELVSMIDLAPTIADLAGASIPDFVDGRPLTQILLGGLAVGWRDAVLVEAVNIKVGRAIRTRNLSFTDRDPADQRELYDLRVDPYQLENIYGTTPDTALVGELVEWADRLGRCSDAGCRAAELAPPGLPLH